MPTELEIKFAKEIRDGFLQHTSDYNRDERTYYCEFCDADSITIWDREDVNMYKAFKHEKTCIVNDAMRVLKEGIKTL